MSALPLLVGGVRAAYGLLAYAVPHRFQALTRLDGTGDSADSAYVTRLYGARDVVLGAATIAPRTQHLALILGAAFDALDSASGLLAFADGKDRSWVRTAAISTAAFAVLGLATAARSAPTVIGKTPGMRS